MIKINSRNILKLCHPDKSITDDKNFDNEFFNLVNYTYKTLDNPIKKRIYDEEGHRGLKIFYNNYNVFEKIIQKFPSKALENEKDKYFIEAIGKIMKKLRKIKFDLIKVNFQKYLKSNQVLKNSISFCDYFNDDLKTSLNISSNRSYTNIQNSREDKYIRLKSRQNNIESIGTQKKQIDKIYLDNINLTQMLYFTFKKSNLAFKLVNSTSYNLKTKNTENSPKLILFFNTNSINMLTNFFKFLPYANSKLAIEKNKLDLKFKFSEVKIKNISLLSMPILKLNKKINTITPSSNKKNLSLFCSVGNKYLDENCKIKTVYRYPDNKFTIKCENYLNIKKTNLIGAKLINIKKVVFYTNFKINKEIKIFSQLKFRLKNSFSFLFLFVYKLSKNLKIKTLNNFEYSIIQAGGLYNVVSLG